MRAALRSGSFLLRWLLAPGRLLVGEARDHSPPAAQGQCRVPRYECRHNSMWTGLLRKSGGKPPHSKLGGDAGAYGYGLGANGLVGNAALAVFVLQSGAYEGSE